MPGPIQNARGAPCDRDSDCPNSTCHYLWRTCTTRYVYLIAQPLIPSYSKQTEDYLTCVMNKFSIPQRSWFENKFDVSLSNPDAISTILNALSNVEPDCLWSNDLQGVPWARISSYYLNGPGDFDANLVLGMDLGFEFPPSPYFVQTKVNRTTTFF